VGIQVGHWRIEEHPDEMAQLRKFSGVYYRGYDEWELNIVIAKAVQARLEAAGVTVDLLPANVPMGYTADAFLSIHVDGVTGATAATRRGWKVTMPFRASAASQGLAAAIGAAYAATTGLPADTEEASNNLRAYYAFASYRYWHSIAPTTPAAIIECGFMTHPADRRLIFDQPALLGEGIARGVLDYLAASYPLSAAARAQVGPGMLRANDAGATLYTRAAATSAPVVSVAAGQRLVPVDAVAGWYLVFTHGGAWDLGWVRAADVVETGEELVPPQPRPET
jgi:N-acetylmuramoyl-L-alanine amidase